MLAIFEPAPLENHPSALNMEPHILIELGPSPTQ